MNTTDLVNASNATSASEAGKLQPTALRTNISVIVISLTIIGLNTVAIYTLIKCRRIPFQIKWLSCNLILTDVIMHVFLIITNACVIQLGQPFLDKVYYLRPVVGGIMVLVSLVSVCSLMLERLLALTKTMDYAELLTRSKVGLLLAYIWLPHTMVPLTIFSVTIHQMCNFDITLRQCDTWLALLPFRLVMTTLYTVYHSFIIYSYIKIFKILHRHVKAITSQTIINTIEKIQPKKKKRNRVDTTTHKIIRVVLTFELINLPFFIHSLLFAFLPTFHVRNIEYMFHVFSYVCSCSNCLINLYLYVWKMKECRFVFLNTFLSWNQRCQDMALRLKREVYPFVVQSKSGSGESTTI